MLGWVWVITRVAIEGPVELTIEFGSAQRSHCSELGVRIRAEMVPARVRCTVQGARGER